jgi:hypothetical protein
MKITNSLPDQNLLLIIRSSFFLRLSILKIRRRFLFSLIFFLRNSLSERYLLLRLFIARGPNLYSSNGILRRRSVRLRVLILRWHLDVLAQLMTASSFFCFRSIHSCGFVLLTLSGSWFGYWLYRDCRRPRREHDRRRDKFNKFLRGHERQPVRARCLKFQFRNSFFSRLCLSF